jgi:hypothetical protein
VLMPDNRGRRDSGGRYRARPHHAVMSGLITAQEHVDTKRQRASNTLPDLEKPVRGAARRGQTERMGDYPGSRPAR